MCYSARIVADYKKYVRHYGADISLEEFVEIYWHRAQSASLVLPPAMDAWFDQPQNPEHARIQELIKQHRTQQLTVLESDLAAQRDRLAAARIKLAEKPTKTAANEERIATKKIATLEEKIDALQREASAKPDMRIWPGTYAPVMVMENGKRVVKPMRYRCRPAGAPAFYDEKFPGTYNARRDNLRGQFWRKLYGHTHGVMIISSFYEIVDRVVDGKLQKVTLQFTPDDGRELVVACLWSEWKGQDGERMLSFAAITTTPPPEVAAAGHDRCIVAIRPDEIDAWLQPKGDLDAMDEILDRRDWAYYAHREVPRGED